MSALRLALLFQWGGSSLPFSSSNAHGHESDVEMTETKPASGPDFEQGALIADFQDGKTRAGHVAGTGLGGTVTRKRVAP